MGLRELLGVVVVEAELDSKSLDKGLDGVKRDVEAKTKGIGERLGGIGDTLTSKITPAAATVAAASRVMAQSWSNAQRDMAATTGFTGSRLADLTDSVADVVGTVKGGMGGVSSVMAELAAKTELAGKPLEDLARKLLGLKELGIEVTVGDVGTAFGRWAVPTDQWGAALERLLKVSQATGVSMPTLLGRLAEFQPVLADLGFNFDQASLMAGKLSDAALPGLKKALATIIATGTTDVPGAFAAMIASIKGATTETEALSLGTEYFGAKAAPSLVDAIRTNKFELGALTAEVEANKGSIMGTVEAHRTWFDQLMLFKDSAAAAIGPYAEKISVLAGGVAAIGPAFKTVSEGWGVAKGALEWVKGLGGAAAVAAGATDILAVSTAAEGVAAGVATAPTASLAGAIWAVTWPVLAVLAAIAALIGIFYLLTEVMGVSVPDAISIMAAAFLGPFGLIVAAVIQLWQHWDEIWGWIKDAFGNVIGFITQRWHDIEDIFGGVKDLIWTNGLKPVIDFIVQGAKDIIEWIGKAASAIASLPGKIGGGMLGPLGGLVSGFFAEGGRVPGAPGSPQLIVAHGGELVLTAAQASAHLDGAQGWEGGGASSPASVVVVHNHIAGSVVTERQLARTTARTTGELRRYGLSPG